jgi:hypothetical protein
MNSIKLLTAFGFKIIFLDFKGETNMDRYDMAERLQALLEQAEEEIDFKDIPGYEGRYAITRDGRIWSHRYKSFIFPHDNG